MKLEIMNVESSESYDGCYIHLFGRDDCRKRKHLKIKGIVPYFYVPKSEGEKNHHLIIKKEEGFKSIFGEDLVKIFVKSPFHIKDVKGLFTKTFEADLSESYRYTTRWMIDNNIFHSVDENMKEIDFDSEMRICYIDIETEYHGGENVDMSRAITALSFFDNYTNKYLTFVWHHTIKEFSITNKKYTSEISKIESDWEIFNCVSEKEMLHKFIEQFNRNDFDIITGWSVERFDITYIFKRLEYYQIDIGVLSPMRRAWYNTERETATIKGRTILDLMKGYKRIYWHQIESFKLDSIGQSEFKIGKIEYTGWIDDFWKNNLERFLEYNIRDIDICVELNKKYDILGFLRGLRNLTGSTFGDVNTNSRMFDIYILRACFGKYVLPTKVYDKNVDYKSSNGGQSERVDHRIQGGFVTAHKPGRLKNVISLDLKSLYPSIMISFNISPEKICDTGEICTVNGLRLDKEEGLLKKILVGLIELRDSIRKDLPNIKDKEQYYKTYKKQYSIKTFSNSAYGILAFSSFRLYNPQLAEAVTLTGQFLLHKMVDLVKGKGYDIAMGDTDSIYVELGDLSKEECIVIGKELAKEINYNIQNVWCKGMGNDSSYLSIKFEKLFDTFFSGVEKKIYAGHVSYKDGVDVDEMDFKGYAVKRSDRSKFTRQLQKRVLEMVLTNKEEKEIVEYIKDEIGKFKKLEYRYEEMGLPRGFSKSPDEFKVTNPWIRGLEYSKKHIVGFEFSPKPYLLYMKGVHKEICYNDENQVPKNIDIDFDKMIENSVKSPLKNILSNLKIDDRFISDCGRGQSFLSDFG